MSWFGLAYPQYCCARPFIWLYRAHDIVYYSTQLAKNINRHKFLLYLPERDPHRSPHRGVLSCYRDRCQFHVRYFENRDQFGDPGGAQRAIIIILYMCQGSKGHPRRLTHTYFPSDATIKTYIRFYFKEARRIWLITYTEKVRTMLLNQ